MQREEEKSFFAINCQVSVDLKQGQNLCPQQAPCVKVKMLLHTEPLLRDILCDCFLANTPDGTTTTGGQASERMAYF